MQRIEIMQKLNELPRHDIDLTFLAGDSDWPSIVEKETPEGEYVKWADVEDLIVVIMKGY